MQNVWARSWHQPDTANPNTNGYDSWFARVTPDSNGYGEVTFPANQFPHGPITVILSAWDTPDGKLNYAHSDNCYLQLYNEGGVKWKQGIPSAPTQASGMSVLLQDDFTGTLSANAPERELRTQQRSPTRREAPNSATTAVRTIHSPSSAATTCAFAPAKRRPEPSIQWAGTANISAGCCLRCARTERVSLRLTATSKHGS
ncbi:hypothetical protein GZH47_01460 [Paenibacillus rhizovicinus]|uniref:Uncharacterized protein n=1 Tax=Paenibacillus rhizovicinus TaxID=2704463 RepID=A0A6C0NYS9_9BACL|nr:hypothetical protein [Paenibacillus rhizovicinus]QHW29632.1 hypothetical protein GZH47_01460 [Paenibacillus rhizovicinus]